MKNLVFIILPILLFFACTEAPKNTPVLETSKAVVSDSAAIANTIHSFYKWYKDFVIDTTKYLDFAEESGKHLKLNQAKMTRYFANFKEN